MGSALWNFRISMEQQEPNPPCAGFTLEGEFLIFPDFPFTGRTRNWVQRCHWPGWATWIEGKVGSRLDFGFPWVFPLCHPGFPLLDVEHGSGYKEKAPKSSWKGRRRIWDGGNAVCPSASEGDPEEKYGFTERFGLTSLQSGWEKKNPRNCGLSRNEFQGSLGCLNSPQVRS